MKHKFPIWKNIGQITLPIAICGVLVFAIGSITMVYMTNGRYLFQVKINSEGLEVKVDLDKKENYPEQYLKN